MENTAITAAAIHRISPDGMEALTDFLAVEEPLELQLLYSKDGVPIRKPVSVTMRTPGHDEELAAGFLFTEGILAKRNQLYKIAPMPGQDNTILASLSADEQPVLHSAERNFYTTSSCGICGKSGIDAIKVASPFKQEKKIPFKVAAEVIYSLPHKLRAQQEAFESTGGLHASALFTTTGNFILLREDVGRHNALDKVIGEAFLDDRLPLSHCILLLSGRASFELIQKAAMAGIQMVVAVGAPSSLAVSLAAEAGITLIGFLRGTRFNIYAFPERIGQL